MAISSTTGLVSGLDIKGIVDALMTAQRSAVSRLQTREGAFKATQTGFNTLSANLLTLSTSASQMASASNFSTYTVASSDPTQLTATVNAAGIPGSYRFQALRLASSQQVISRGFTDTNQQTVGAGVLTFANGGKLATSTTLDVLNGGSGVRRGVIRVTDRSGATADIDLTSSATVDDVVASINNAQGISVVATTRGDKIEIADTSGETDSNLIVVDRNGGHAAQDLGIAKSVAADTLSGSSVYSVTGAFTLSRLNDGNGVRLIDNVADIRISLTDDPPTTLDVDLNGASTLNDVIGLINNHADNGGKVTAAISNGRLVLTDNTGGGGSGNLTVTDLNDANVVQNLGLDQSATGNTLTGKRLAAGIDSVLLRNLRGGEGIDELGSITLTDRTGTTATIDLSTAESLDEVIHAINSARDTNDVKLQLTASLNAAGNGLQVRDTSGANANNLVIEDVGDGTLAAQLGIAVDAAQDSVSSSSLHLRYVNESTSLSKYAPGGTAVRRGSFSITDSTGELYFVNITNASKNLGDVIQRINTATNGKVTAQLNETGDGLVLVDNAEGTGQILVRDLDSGTAADLRIAGTGTTGPDNKSRIVSRLTTTITLTGTETLQGLADKINGAKAGLTAAIIDDGTSFSPKRLVLTSKQTGSAGSFLFDDNGLGLALEQSVAGQDALLRMGLDTTGGFLVSSSTNHFDAVQPGMSVDIKTVGTTSARIDVAQDTAKISNLVSGFVRNYNAFVAKAAELTKFDTNTNTGGALQGESLVLRLKTTLSDLVSGTTFGSGSNTIRSLRDLGINFTGEGTLTFESDKLSTALARDPQAVSDFFITAQTGFAAKLKRTVETYTDPLTGQITTQTNSLQASVDNLEKRITVLNQVLTARQERLLRQFYNLETILSGLTSQQQALGKIQNLSAPTTS